MIGIMSRPQELATKVMRAFAESTVWSVLKRLTMGLALIALLSSILLISDLAHRRTTSAVNAGGGSRKFKAAIVYYAHSVSSEFCANGLLDGLKASGLEQGKNLEIVRADAQGEMINIPAILQNYDSSDVDLIMTISTPCLAGAFRNNPESLWSLVRADRIYWSWSLHFDLVTARYKRRIRG